MKTQLRFAALAVVPLLLTACGPKRQPGGLMDDPRTHSDRAKQYYDAGDNDRARQEYTLALELNKKFAPALAGLGMLEARLHNWDEAEKDIKKAIDYDDKSFDGRMAWGVYLGEKYRGKDSDDWLPEAEAQFDKAVDRAPKEGEVWYRRGIVRQWALRLREAGEAYSKVLEINGAYTTPANEAWAKIQKIERAASRMPSSSASAVCRWDPTGPSVPARPSTGRNSPSSPRMPSWSPWATRPWPPATSVRRPGSPTFRRAAPTTTRSATRSTTT